MAKNIEPISEEQAASLAEDYLKWEDENSPGIPVDGVVQDAVQQEPEKEAEEPEAEVEAEAKTEETEPEEPELPKTIDELAEAIGVDADDILGMEVEAMIDGEKVKLPVKELLNGYQRDSSYTRKTQKLAEERRTFEQRSEQAYKAVQSDLIVAAEAAKKAEEELAAIIGSHEMKYLLESDPQEWAKQQIALDRKKQEISSFREGILADLRQVDSARKAEYERAAQDGLTREKELLLEKLPEWRDNEKGHSEWLKIVSNLEASYGFSRAELGSISDHRLILLARDALLYKEGKKAAKDVKSKKLAQLPKITVKPTAQAATQKPEGKRQTELRKILRSKDAPTRLQEKAAAELIADML